MIVQIKSDMINLEELMTVSFSDLEKTIVVFLKGGATIAYALKEERGIVSKSRVITTLEYSWILERLSNLLRPEKLT